MKKNTATIKELQLLHFIKKTGSVSQLSHMGEDYKHLNMGVLRSIEKKGFVKENPINHAWYLTELGKEVVSKNKEPLPPLNTGVISSILEGIKQSSTDPERICAIVDQTIRKYINPNY